MLPPQKHDGERVPRTTHLGQMFLALAAPAADLHAVLVLTAEELLVLVLDDDAE